MACWCVVDDVCVCVWELIFYLLPRVFSLFVKGVDVTRCVASALLYLFAFATNRRALSWVVCNLCLVWRIRELRVTVGYMKAGRIVALYSLRALS